MNKLSEDLVRASHSVAFAHNNLQEALSSSTPVSCIVILRMIEKACELKLQIEYLLEAVEAEKVTR
jgi:hypothetical protein